MNESNMKKVSFIIFLIGIILLYMILQNTTAYLKIGEIKEDMIGENVIITAFVESVYTIDNGRIIEIKDDTGSIKTVVWEAGNNEEIIHLIRELSRGDKITVSGEIKKYKNELEIIIDEIKKKS